MGAVKRCVIQMYSFSAPGCVGTSRYEDSALYRFCTQGHLGHLFSWRGTQTPSLVPHYLLWAQLVQRPPAGPTWLCRLQVCAALDRLLSHMVPQFPYLGGR